MSYFVLYRKTKRSIDFLLKLYMAKVGMTFENYNCNFVSKVGIAFFMGLFGFVCKGNRMQSISHEVFLAV